VLICVVADFGKEKKLPLKGLDDKAIEQQVSDLVQSKI
jgi:NADH dehydrogenase (ubiquinone) 1 alpha subcomplex subunit 2